jgi:hypothetical protein
MGKTVLSRSQNSFKTRKKSLSTRSNSAVAAAEGPNQFSALLSVHRLAFSFRTPPRYRVHKGLSAIFHFINCANQINASFSSEKGEG